MLQFLQGGESYCDGHSRRHFLKVGGLAIGGLTLPSLLRAEEAAGSKATGKSIINIYLGGGPTHLDTFDLKPLAPSEYRGEFRPIATNAPGVEICELMPELATVANHYTVIRSIRNMANEHSPRQSDSGWSENSVKSIGGRPSIGSVMSKVWGASQSTDYGTAPTFVDLSGWTKPGFLGQVHAAYRPDGTGRSNLEMNRSLTVERLDDRRTLLTGLDRIRREADSSGMMTAIDSFTDRAVGLVTSGELAKALDFKKESAETLERYGLGKQRRSTENFLVARRLVEAGVRCVSFSWGGWDTHGQNFMTMKNQLPALSKALTSLIQDLEERGRLEETIIMMSGEFGRTPRINSGAGRDHWPQAAFFFLAGGGMRHGQVIGSTNARGELPIERPVSLQNVFQTVYHKLGIDTDGTLLTDPNGRPQFLLDDRQTLRELV